MQKPFGNMGGKVNPFSDNIRSSKAGIHKVLDVRLLYVVPQRGCKQRSPLFDLLRIGIRRTDQSCENNRLSFVQAGWLLVENPTGRGRYPLQLSPEAYKVQIGFKNLLL